MVLQALWPCWSFYPMSSCLVALSTAQIQTMLGPGHPPSVFGRATACSGLSFPICPWRSWWEGAERVQMGRPHAACFPSKALFSFLLPLEGKLPINKRELQTQHLAPRPRSLGKQGRRERAGRGIGNKCRGVFFGGSIIRSPPPTPTAVPNLDLYGNGFHAWASHELS